MQKQQLVKFETSCKELYTKFPPKFLTANKKVLQFLSCTPEHDVAYENLNLIYSRYQALLLPKLFTAVSSTILEMKQDIFTYDVPQAHCYEWHLNFAHEYLFVAYSGGLFAQDEIQVAEHPILGSLRHYLELKAMNDGNYRPVTVKNNHATPILIQNVPRKIAVAVDANAEQGRPHGLYGNQFAQASKEAVHKAVTVLQPPTISNIIAMEAPSRGFGEYTKQQIQFILESAYTGFAAAKFETQCAGQQLLCKIHTGNWGTGAYGNNATLIALLQILAARTAQVDHLVYHTFAAPFSEAYQNAVQILDTQILPQGTILSCNELLDAIVAQKFKWGFSDGN